MVLVVSHSLCSPLLRENVRAWFAENPSTPNHPFQPGAQGACYGLA